MNSLAPLIAGARAGRVVSNQRCPTREQLLLAEAQTGLLVQRDGSIVYTNPAADAMLGWPPGALVGRNMMGSIAPEDHEHVREQARQRQAGAPGHVYDIRCLRSDGSLFDARICGRLIDFDGQPAVLVTLFDVSELKQALRQAEWSASLLERSELLCGSGSFEIEWPSGAIKASAGLRSLTGLGAPSDDVQSHGCIDALPWVPEDERALVATIWRSATPGEPFEFQHRIVSGDGARRVVLHRGVLQAAEANAPCRRGQAILQDITEQREAERRIQELANFDEVTGLPNRASFLDQVDAAIHLAHWDDREFALLAIEVPKIDELKSTMGFGAGDSLAMAIAARLRCGGAEGDFLAHLGGSEFAALLPLAKGETTAAVRQRALALQAALQLSVSLAGTEVFPMVQIGIAIYPTDAGTAPAVLEAAQTGWIGADVNGGVSFFRRESNAPAVRELQLHAALRHAIDRAELQLVYQPQVSLESGEIVGVEALLRWTSAEWGEVSPAEFIPLAERTGLIDAIGDWVLRQACRQSVAWRQAGLRAIRIGVNVSPRQFQLNDVAHQVQAMLIDTGADPADIGIEITESTLMADVERATAMLRELKSIGVEISLDDFGTGYSSLSSLSRLPIDIVKVDRSFVHDVTASPESVSVTRAIITMSHGLQLRVLAEGVETDGQLSLLSANGCDQVQGFWFSCPVPPDEIETMLRERRMLPERFLRHRERRRTLLLVDDEDNIIASLKRLLRRDGYHIITARSGAEGLQCLAEHEVDVIVSDQRMPGMSGVEFLRRAKALYPHTVRMTLSGFTDLQSIIDAVNEGAIYKFLTKPWDDELLRSHVAEAFRQKELADENRRLSGQVARANAELETVNGRLAGLLQAQQAQSALLAASASGARDMLDELPVAVFGLDAEGAIAYVNRAASSLLPQALEVLGELATEALPNLLGCELPPDGCAVDVDIEGRSHRALCHRLDANTGAAPERGRLLVLTANRVLEPT